MWWHFDPTVYAGLLGLFFGHGWLARGRNLPLLGVVASPLLRAVMLLWHLPPIRPAPPG